MRGARGGGGDGAPGGDCRGRRGGAAAAPALQGAAPEGRGGRGRGGGGGGGNSAAAAPPRRPPAPRRHERPVATAPAGPSAAPGAAGGARWSRPGAPALPRSVERDHRRVVGVAPEQHRRRPPPCQPRRGPLVFVGDSVLRYIFVALLWWLHASRWPAPTARTQSNQFLAERFGSADPSDRYQEALAANASLVWQKEWPSWEAYLRGSTEAFGGAMCCDCLRGPQPHVNKRKVTPARVMRKMRNAHWRSQRENRFYVAPGGAWRASFFFLHGDFEGNGMRPGHREGCPGMMGGNASEPPVWPPRDWAERWRGTTPEIRQALQESGEAADVVVFNTGLWYPGWVQSAERAARAVDAAEAMLGPARSGGKRRAVWQTVTQQCQRVREVSHEEAIIRALRGRSEWSVLDAGAVTEELARDVGMPMSQLPRGHAAAMEMKQFGGFFRARCSAAYVDTNGHFQPFVYRELALLLLEAIGC
eukprot:TRINITY_DN34830_c0_g1_i1.p1 TRINITY_DN34830_c0_g1~~TRINITY_DN34830_c0_g1_i1.p1  ORF type:complete len:475 (+),score=81.60 TRINITY_DN34830_c0_g1_i1:95-1519(+)